MTQWFQSSNGSKRNGEIHSIAVQQLALYQETALDWPRYPDGRAIRCGKCDQALLFTYDIQGTAYAYADHEILALIVAHIRERHSEVVCGND